MPSVHGSACPAEPPLGARLCSQAWARAGARPEGRVSAVLTPGSAWPSRQPRPFAGSPPSARLCCCRPRSTFGCRLGFDCQNARRHTRLIRQRSSHVSRRVRPYHSVLPHLEVHAPFSRFQWDSSSSFAPSPWQSWACAHAAQRRPLVCLACWPALNHTINRCGGVLTALHTYLL